MKVLRILIVAAVLIAAITQLQAQPAVETITVDTLVNLGKTGGGEAQGALFLPDGNIIAVWNGRPMIIDSKTGEIIRKLDLLPSGYASSPELSTDGTKLVTRVSGPELAVWDVISGKIVFQLEKEISYFCISPDGTRLFVTLPNNKDNPGIIVIYDMNTFQEIKRLSYFGVTWGGKIDISPNGETLAVSVEKKTNSSDKNTDQVLLIDAKNMNNYTVLETVEPGVQSMEFSPDGTKLAYRFDAGNANTYIYIFDLVTKEKKYIQQQEITTLFGSGIMAFGNPFFIDETTILFGILDFSEKYRYELVWNLQENRLKKLMKYLPITVEIKDSTLLMCNFYGLIAYQNKDFVPVQDIVIQNESYLMYNNNQLEYYSDNAFVGELSIFDTTGKLITNLGSQPIIIGKNIIRVNQILPIGIYILTIKSGQEQISKKFLVE